MYGDSDCDIRIMRHQNGYTVRITDPALVKSNRERKTKTSDDCCSPSEWKDPQVSYAFTTRDEVTKFIKENIDKALPDDVFSSTFDQAAKDAK